MGPLVRAADFMLACGSTDAGGGAMGTPDAETSEASNNGPMDGAIAVAEGAGGGASSDAPSSSHSDGQSARDSAAAPEASSDASAGGCTLDSRAAACTAPAPCGALVTGTTLKGTPPPAMGGSITPGTHQLVSFAEYYTVMFVPPPPLRVTRVLSATEMHSTVQDGTSRLVFDGPYTAAANTISWNVTCPAELAGPTSFLYTATANQLIIHQPQGGNATYVLVHERVQ